jgi:hypothetical protein
VKGEKQAALQTPGVRTKPLGREQEIEITGPSGALSDELSAGRSDGVNFPSLSISTQRV